jgi:hypothetical protein
MLIKAKLFYQSGIACFLIIGICNLINFFIFYDNGNIYSHIASLGGIVFNFMLVGFFYYLYKTQSSTLPEEAPEDIREAVKEFKK